MNYSIFDLDYDRNIIRAGAYPEENLETKNAFTEGVAPGLVGPIGGKYLPDMGELAWLDESDIEIEDIINDRIDTQQAYIKSNWTFTESGAFVVKTDNDNGMWFSPTGILAKKLGNTTLTITNEGDATFAGILSAASGTLGTITSANIELGSSGYIRTASSGARLELERDMGSGYTHGLLVYRSEDSVLFRLFADGGTPCLSIFGGDAWGGAQILNSSTTATFPSLKLTGAGLHNILDIEANGSQSGRSDYGSINLSWGDDATKGSGIKISRRSVDSPAILPDEIETMSQRGGAHCNILNAKATGSGWTSVQAFRLTSEGFLQLPAYYHRSEFDEYNVALASSVIANAYWVGDGDGFQIISSADPETYLRLSTTATASRYSSATFRRATLNSIPTAIEFRFKISNKSNATYRIGLTGSNYFYLEFDSAADANLMYLKSQSGASTSSVKTDFNPTVDHWYIIRFLFLASNNYYWWVDDNLRTDGGSQYVNVSSAKPFMYVDNKSAAEDKNLYVDYFDIWAGRP